MEAIQKYRELRDKLVTEVLENGDSVVADEIRDEMDIVWRQMTPEQRKFPHDS